MSRHPALKEAFELCNSASLPVWKVVRMSVLEDLAHELVQASPMTYLLQPLKYVQQFARSIYDVSDACTEESAIFASCSYIVIKTTTTLGPYKL